MTSGSTRRLCSWCSGPISPRARADAKFCSTSHRQASHRAKVRRSELEATAHPLRLAYADPPYIGLADRYYGSDEVDPIALLSRLETYDGWALSCSAASIPELFAYVGELDLVDARRLRLAVWLRRRPPHPTARVLNVYEGVIYRPARTVVLGSERLTDVLTDTDARPRPTLPSSIIGMKPPRFSAWLFGLLGAMPGDSFDDLFPGSGLVSRAWAEWSAPATHDERRHG